MRLRVFLSGRRPSAEAPTAARGVVEPAASVAEANGGVASARRPDTVTGPAATGQAGGEDFAQWERGKDRAPDVPEEILAWKVLALSEEGWLCRDFDRLHHVAIPGGLSSPTREAQWPTADWLVARCNRHPEHEPPVEDCTCGIYAVSEANAARSYIWEAPLTVLVRVGLAGKVIPGTRGWRAECARVVALTQTGAGPRDYPKMLAQIAHRYRVPILDLDFLGPRPAGAAAQRKGNRWT